MQAENQLQVAALQASVVPQHSAEYSWADDGTIHRINNSVVTVYYFQDKEEHILKNQSDLQVNILK